MKPTNAQRVFQVCNTVFLLLLSVVMLYPMWHVVMASLSDSGELMAHRGVLLAPLHANVNAYRLMSQNPMILRGFFNSVLIVVSGTVINIILTSLGAYVLSKRKLYWRRAMSLMVLFTMFFSGGMIPLYLVVSKVLMLGDSFLAVILPTAVNTYNLIIMRTAFEGLPESLEESAQIEGAGHWTILFRIVLPLSMSTVAVMVLYYATGHWNGWFNASIFIKTRVKYPLQLILREILINNDTANMSMGGGGADDMMGISETIKYAVIVASTLPVLCIYPFLQKYFVKGVLIGAVKG